MAKHNKQRSFERVCPTCSSAFMTGSAIKIRCSAECRVRTAAQVFDMDVECWNWRGSINPQTGYGQMSEWRDGKRVLLTAHRVSFLAFKGDIPAGIHVLHTCDNRKCFNPKHLFLGAHADNMADRNKKGRCKARFPAIHWTKRYPERIKRGTDHPLSKDSSCMPRGDNHKNSKVTCDDVRAIRASTETLAALSVKYGISQSSLSSIRLRKTWKHVE